jgi:hypothetical protein
MATGLKLAIAAATALGLVGPAGATPQGDTTPPTIGVTVAGQKGAAGWYVADTTVTWTVRDRESAVSSTSGCRTVRVTRDTRGRRLTCRAVNAAGLRAQRSVTIRLDETPPSVAATPARPPDVNGWYNRPFTVTYTGRDSTSGVVSCDGPSMHAGPDGVGLVASGGCTDRAGLKGVGTYQFQYDATPTGPVVDLRGEPGDHRVTLTWRRPPEEDVDRYVVTRTGPRTADVLVYEGRNAATIDRTVANGIQLRYDVVVVDRAGNRSTVATSTVVPAARLLVAPRPGAKVTAAPLLRWAPYRSPRYYNVQLWRGGGKILSAWPARARLKLQRTWTFNGRRYTLSPGRYRWYVFPGYGQRSAAHYGSSLGSSVFFVVR